MSKKPVFFAVHGAFHSPECFELLAPRVESRGYKFHSVQLPSVGAEPPLETFDEDVATVHTALSELTGRGEDVVVVMHSYGGVIGTNAVESLPGPGRVVRLVYVVAQVLAEGESVDNARTESPSGFEIIFEIKDARLPRPLHLPGWLLTSEQGGYVFVHNPIDAFYHDVDKAVAEKNAKRLKHQSLGPLQSVTKYAGWKHFPSAFYVCNLDRIMPLAVQESMIEKARRAVPTAFDIVGRVDASHSPFLSRPDELAQFLIGTVGGA